MGTDTQRLARMIALRERGWSAQAAGVAALAVMPFDDYPVPERAFEKAVRKRVRVLRKQIRNESEVETAAHATQALRDYRELAFTHGESHYKTRFDITLGIEDSDGATHE